MADNFGITPTWILKNYRNKDIVYTDKLEFIGELNLNNEMQNKVFYISLSGLIQNTMFL